MYSVLSAWLPAAAICLLWLVTVNVGGHFETKRD